MGRTAGPVKDRKHVVLTEGRWDRLVELYGASGISPSHVIDQLVGFHLKRIDEKVALKKGSMTAILKAEAEADDEIDLTGIDE